MKFLQLGFIPSSAGVALLVLRLWLGLTILLNHGLAKLTGFGEMAGEFPDPLHIGSTGSLALAVLAEVVAAAFLALGLCTRFAALVLVIELGVAFCFVHGCVLSGAHGGELAFIYLAGFVTLFLAGGGCCTLDSKLAVSAK